MKLSILICTIPERQWMFLSLYKVLQDIIDSDGMPVELLWDNSPDITIGQKRNLLLSKSKGEYVVFIDDDDMPSMDYIDLILKACESGSDCIGISGFMTTNGTNIKLWHISKEYPCWLESMGVYLRTPNHISPVRRELAIQAGFPEINHGEDAEYSKRLHPLLKTETKIDQLIYHYRFITKR